MLTDTMVTYKLMILFMLNKVDFALTNSQICEFFLEKEYTNYFNVQQAIHSLEETGFIKGNSIRNMTHYHITDAGIESLEMFENKISHEFKYDILHFLDEKKYQLRNEVAITAQYFPQSSNEYLVNCVIKEKKTTMLDLNINVSSEDQAISICDIWKEKSSDVYTYLVNELLLNDSTATNVKKAEKESEEIIQKEIEKEFKHDL